MKHHAKAASAGSTEAGGNSRGLFRRALATRGASCDAKGSGARSSCRLRAVLATLALAITAFAITAPPALAAPPIVSTPTVEPSYTSVRVEGKVTTDGSGLFTQTIYGVEYSTDGTNWIVGSESTFGSNIIGPAEHKPVATFITGLKSGTEYFVRLRAWNVPGFFEEREAGGTSPTPYPSFSTLVVEPPTIVAINDASEVFSQSIMATGKVKRPANSDPAFNISSCRFELVTAAQFSATGFKNATTAACEPSVPYETPNGETNVSAEPEGLIPSTTYHLRLAAENAAPAAATKEAAHTFTTLPAATAKPAVLATNDATEVGKRSAEVSGEVERPAGADPALNVHCHFEYVTEKQFTENVGNSHPGFEGAGQVPCAGRNEVQQLTVAATAGQFRLIFNGQTSNDVPFNATAIEVRNALAGTLGQTDGLTVTGGPGDGAGSSPYRITFSTAGYGFLGEKDQPQIVVTNGTTPLAGTANVTTLVTGATAFEVLNGPPTNQAKDSEMGAELQGLEPDTTYHLRLTAENKVGAETKEAAHTFTTVALVHPALTVDSITEVGYSSFRVTGTADPGNQGVYPFFEFAPAGTEEWVGNPIGRFGPFEGSPVQVSWNFPHEGDSAPLKPGTTYKVRLYGWDTEEYGQYESAKPYPEFTTLGTNTPAATTLSPVTGVTATSAHFAGTVNTHAPAGTLPAEAKPLYKTDWHFECTPECPENAGTIHGTLSGEEGEKPASFDAINLEPNTFYEVKLIATNALGPVESAVQTFQTPLVAPTVTASPGVTDGRGGYFLEGIVNSNNTKVTKCKFEYGTTATYPNTYEAECRPSPSGPDEVQLVNVEATSGQFKLELRGQTTSDLAYNATAAQVQSALRALPKIGANGVEVSGNPGAYKVTFNGGGLSGANVEPLKGSNGTTPLGGGAGVSVLTETEGGTNHAVSIEAHLEALTPGATYHFRIFATSAGGTTSTVDRIFIPTLEEKGPPCPNEAIRNENSSEALPECRAYEMVTSPNKEGYNASLKTYDGGDRVAYKSGASNIASSGQGGGTLNEYVATRTATGWETIPDLNGSSGSLRAAPSNVDSSPGGTTLHAYSSDLLSSTWTLHRQGDSGYNPLVYLRNPDGTFALIGSMRGENENIFGASHLTFSTDLSHVVGWTFSDLGASEWGPGVYEYVGTGMTQPRRVDLDNSGAPISACIDALGNAMNDSVSSDGSRIVNFVYGGCGGANPPAGELWARINGTTSVDVSASHCDRTASDPGGVCNGPTEPGGCTEFLNDSNGLIEGTGCRTPQFFAATPDGSRVFFTTTQQLVNGDTDQTNDIYYCDLPSGNPAPTAGKANPCSAFGQVSVPESGAAEVEKVFTTSEDGSTALFAAKGVLASNEDALKEQAVAGNNNLYVWHQDAAHPEGQTSFVAKLKDSDVDASIYGLFELKSAQATPDGRYVAFTVPDQLVESDADQSSDVYRVDAETGELVRVSTNVFGVGGNGPFDAGISGPAEHHPTTAISDDGQKIVFTTYESLSPLDGNGEPDIYLWTPSRVSLISTGSSGFAPRETALGGFSVPYVAIDGSGKDIYFETALPLTPADGDSQVDVYDARVDGGFSFPPKPTCNGEGCQPSPTPAPPKKAPLSAQPGPGNPIPPKPCPSGKVRNKNGLCVVKQPKKHHGKKAGHKRKKAGHKRGGGK